LVFTTTKLTLLGGPLGDQGCLLGPELPHFLWKGVALTRTRARPGVIRRAPGGALDAAFRPQCVLTTYWPWPRFCLWTPGFLTPSAPPGRCLPKGSHF